MLAAEVAVKRLPSNTREAHLSILVCGDRRTRSINRLHRGKDRTTDVLSFPVQNNLKRGKGKWDWAAPGTLLLGDIVLCLPQAQRQAKRFGIGLEEELVHLFFHGFLHVLGHDHELSRADEKHMQGQEDLLLEEFSRLKKKRAR